MTSDPSQLEHNKAVVRRLIEEWWNQQNQAVVDEIIDPTFVDHNRPGQPPGPEGVRQGGVALGTENPFPDSHFIIEAITAEDDMVTVCGTWRGTHQRDWNVPIGVFAPTGKQVSMTALAMFRLASGKLVEFWSGGDRLDVLRQLGNNDPVSDFVYPGAKVYDRYERIGGFRGHEEELTHIAVSVLAEPEKVKQSIAWGRRSMMGRGIGFEE